MVQSALNTLLFRHLRTEILKNKFIKIVETEAVEGFVEILLKLMSLILCIDKDFRRNIKDFNAKYLLMDKAGKFTIWVILQDEKLTVSEKPIEGSNATIIFKDQHALFNFIISPNPDIINALLNQDVTFKGNMNYITKFVYMAKHLRIQFMGA